jgi:anthranilate synthase/aminodeoxychorismate synthase-like glutamine amidotransferase
LATAGDDTEADPSGGHRYGGGMAPRVLVLDNYDSFVFNLVQYLGELGAEPMVHRNDERTLDELVALDPDGVLISPGPGTPDDAGLSNALIAHFTGRRPVLGVCLGHQCIGQVFGGEVVRAPLVMHGKTSQVHHDGKGVFAGLPEPFEATRYHSLVVAADSVPDSLEVSARTDDGVVMGLRHRQHPTTEGVQFHPESILTAGGHDLVANWLRQLAPSSA